MEVLYVSGESLPALGHAGGICLAQGKRVRLGFFRADFHAKIYSEPLVVLVLLNRGERGTRVDPYIETVVLHQLVLHVLSCLLHELGIFAHAPIDRDNDQVVAFCHHITLSLLGSFFPRLIRGVVLLHWNRPFVSWALATSVFTVFVRSSVWLLVNFAVLVAGVLAVQVSALSSIHVFAIGLLVVATPCTTVATSAAATTIATSTATTIAASTAATIAPARLGCCPSLGGHLLPDGLFDLLLRFTLLLKLKRKLAGLPLLLTAGLFFGV
mmetsp:Transcript_19178/g.34110  ORF Transcript_19178/g.34110 Transcript_19178/m.34110 type:complete len:269 (-) Transcript_19178:81-887(-)